MSTAAPGNSGAERMPLRGVRYTRHPLPRSQRDPSVARTPAQPATPEAGAVLRPEGRLSPVALRPGRRADLASCALQTQAPGHRGSGEGAGLAGGGHKGSGAQGWGGEVKGPVRPGWACREAAVSELACAQRGREGPAPGREGAARLKATPAGGGPGQQPAPRAFSAARGPALSPERSRNPTTCASAQRAERRGDVWARGPGPRLGTAAGAAAGAA